MDLEYQPKTLEECHDYLDIYLQDKEVFKNYPEDNLMDIAHMTLGKWIRNKWYLWWNESVYDEVKKNNPNYPSEKPEIVKFFNELGITNGDEMSSIIIMSYHNKLNEKSINFNDIENKINEIIEYYNEKHKS